MLRHFSQHFFQSFIRHFVKDRSSRQIVGENEVSGESLRESFVELENVFEALDVDHVDVAVSQGPDVNGRFGQSVFPPLGVAENVSLTEES